MSTELFAQQSGRRWRIAVIVVLTVIPLLVPSAAIAHNAPGFGVNYSTPSGCTAGRLCVYSGTSFSGSFAQFAQDNANWTCCPSAEDNDESAYNNGTTGNTVKVFELPNFGGAMTYCLRLGHGYKFLASTLGSHHANNGDSNDWQVAGC